MESVLNIPKSTTAIYTRVSTDEQVMQGYSLDAQFEAAINYINSQPNLQYVEHFTDPGVSGKNIEGRPGLKRLLTAIEQGKIKTVVVWKNSRLTRSVKDLLTIMETLARNNASLYSLSEGPVVDTATGRLQQNLLAALNQYERENISENVFSGMAKRASQGYTSTRAPLGYENEKDVNGTPNLVVNEEEAKIVRFIFEEYAYHNQGYRAIANKLNQLGYKTKPGNAFSTIAVKDILNNETYRGRVVWGKYKDWEKYRRSRGKNPDVITADGKFEPIVSEDLWNARIKRMAEATRNPKWNGQGTNTLTGVLRCPECGSAMAASNTTNTLKDGTKKKIRYYSCSVFRAKGSAACHANSIRADEIERLVNQRLLEVVQLTNFGQTVLDEMKIVYKEKKEEIRIGLQAKEADMKKVIKNIEDYQQLIKNDKTLQGVLTNTIEAQKRELERINVEVDELKLEREALIAIPSQEAMQSALELVAASTMQSRGNKHELKALYKTIMESVTFDKRTKTVTVNLKLDNDIVAQLRSALKKGESVEGSPFLSGLVRIPIR